MQGALCTAGPSGALPLPPMPPFAPRPHHSLSAAVRAHFGLSQQALARLLGCHQATVARDEAGGRLVVTRRAALPN